MSLNYVLSINIKSIKSIFNLQTKYLQVAGYATKNLRMFKEGNLEENEDNLSHFLLNKKNISVTQWKTVRDDILNSCKNMTTKNIDSLVINFCIQHKRHEQAKHYIKYLKKENIKLNLGGIGKYFRLHHALYIANLSTEEDENDILSTYKSLSREYPILDSITNEFVILGLSVTKEWKECFKLLKHIKISCKPNGPAYNALVSAAFRNCEYDTGWNLLQEMIENNRMPSSDMYIVYLNQIGKYDDEIKQRRLSDLLEFSTCYDLTFDEEVAKKILQITDKKSRLTTIKNDGVCRACNQQLMPLNLTTSEFEQLKKAFFEEVVVGRDVFCKSTPEELRRYKTFLNDMDNFDVVIDGLNVQYSAGAKQSPQVHSMLLASVVRHFTQQGKKVLVCGRSHMEKLPKENWNFVKRNAAIFLTENISQDDPYILYCALYCGINTIIVTRDFMRSHRYLLKNKHNKLLFNRWLTHNRFHLLYATPEKATFKVPLPYMITAQKIGNTWHVPYTLPTDDSLKNPIYKWLCIDT